MMMMEAARSDQLGGLGIYVSFNRKAVLQCKVHRPELAGRGSRLIDIRNGFFVPETFNELKVLLGEDPFDGVSSLGTGQGLQSTNAEETSVFGGLDIVFKALKLGRELFW